MRFAVVHGPNLNLLGQREPGIYGHVTLAAIDRQLGELAHELGVELESFQSNTEGALIDYIQEAGSRCDGYVVNAGGLTHTSVSLLDALLAVGRPFVEVHLSNPAGRERFRRRSMLAGHARGLVQGFGAESYALGLRGLVQVVRGGVHEQAMPAASHKE